MNKKDFAAVLGVIILYLVFVAVYWQFFGDVMTDSGRELYRPVQMLDGQVLYKDIFNIFGPLSYQFNALLYKIFGVDANVLKTAGALNGAFIMVLLYAIARVFLNRGISFLIIAWYIVLGAFSLKFYNFVLPYAYAMPYSLSAFLVSFLCLLRYFKTPDKTRLLPLACLFAGISVTNKYDCVVACAVVLAAVFYQRKLVWQCAAAFLAVPAVSFGILFWQGLTWAKFLEYLYYLKRYVSSPALHYFFVNK